MITWQEEGIWQTEECGISLWAKMMHGDIAAAECTNQIYRKIMSWFVNMIFVPEKYELHTEWIVKDRSKV